MLRSKKIPRKVRRTADLSRKCFSTGAQRSGDLCGLRDAQSTSTAIEETNPDTCSKEPGSMLRLSTASNAWPTNSRVGAKEVGKSARPPSSEVAYAPSARDPSLTPTHPTVTAAPL